MIRTSKFVSAMRSSASAATPIECNPDWACNVAYNIGGNVMTRTVSAIAALAALLLAQVASAAEITVYSTIGVKSVLEELVPQFEKATGNKLNISWGLISSFTKKAQEGEV